MKTDVTINVTLPEAVNLIYIYIYMKSFFLKRDKRQIKKK